jgi:anti-anti-sigma factor
MNVRIGRDSVVVAPSGEIDIASAPLILDALTDALTKSRVSTVVFDMLDVTFMDSSAVKCIIYALHRMRVREGRVVVCNASRPVARVVRILGLASEVDLYDAGELSIADPSVTSLSARSFADVLSSGGNVPRTA